ncbi:MAG: hypothetical protein KatS3mg110_1534 [Pirellulaceae bacterium]|nr:MAG: hypothetical protein KatS3mg110_1534 [Pirellulaceae bacterium]
MSQLSAERPLHPVPVAVPEVGATQIPIALDHDTARSSGARLGVACGLLSVLGYTLANVGLRRVAHWDPAWVSAMKAIPTLVIMALWLWRLGHRGVRLWPDRHGWRWLAVGSLAGQFGGNWAFQWSLGTVGLAYAVPLSTASMILSGALLGRLFLHESLRPRSLLAMTLLILAAVLLSVGVHQGTAPSSGTLTADTPAIGWGYGILGAAAALLSGTAYAFLGVSIRRTVTQQVPIATVMFVVAATGVLTMGSVGLLAQGPRALVAIAATEYGWMLLAGLFTTGAFVCLTIALRETSVTYVNSLSAAQVAASSVLGHMLFGEPWTIWLLAGVLLTVLGLWLLPHGEPRPASAPQKAAF